MLKSLRASSSPGLLGCGMPAIPNSPCKAALTSPTNAAHALCLAALRRLGYRPRRRYIVFQVLPHTLNLGPEVWRVLDKCHNVRNVGEYEGGLDVDERLVADLVDACQAVADAISLMQD